MAVLVTGGAGFLGSHIAEELINMQYDVVVLDDLSGGFLENVPGGATFIKGNITDAEIIKQVFQTYRIEYIFHLAAYAAENLSHFIRRFNYENNVVGSMNLINAAINHHVNCIVFTSSSAVYGNNQLPFHEELPPMPSDPYGVAKFAVEQDIKLANMMFNLPYIIFRPHNIYGERQNIGDKYRNVVGIFMNQILRDKPMTIFGDGRQSRSFSYIKDVAPIIAKSIHHQDAYNQVLNIGADAVVTLNELAANIASIMGVTLRIEYLDARHEVKHVHAAHEKIKKIFGIFAGTPLEEGLRKMYNWVKQHGGRTSTDFERLEVTKNLPGVWRKRES